MRRAIITLIFIFLCIICATAKKNKDEDFSEFDDFDPDEFDSGMIAKNLFRLLRVFISLETPSSTSAPPSSAKIEVNKPEKEDLSQPESSKKKQDEVTIDDDEDESMFDEEEFESVNIKRTYSIQTI